MKVVLLNYTPDPEKTVAAAAKICYSPSGIDDIYDGLDEEKSSEFVKMLSRLGHESPTEHVTFTFGIEGVSRSFLAQITRHRIASYSVQSQRYVKEDNFEYVVPPEIAENPKAAQIYDKLMMDAFGAYTKLSEILTQKHLAEFEAKGLKGKAARSAAEKQAIEDARFVLPNASSTKMIVTFNVRSLHNFFRHRLCNRAQWEIRAVAAQMYDIVKDIAPSLFAKAGPSCAFDTCGEGKMSCGKSAEMKKRYGK